MRLLASPKDLREALREGFELASAITVATAWASCNFEGFELIKQHRTKIRRILVGIHFYQTHPDFIQEFLNERAVRFIMSPEGTFHPKLYFFEMRSGQWQCIIGSANFTRAAFESNAEIAVLIESKDADEANFRKQLFSALDEWWLKGKKLDANDLERYRKKWKRSLETLPKAPLVFGKPTPNGIQSDGGMDITKVPICAMDWSEFERLVRNERNSSNKLMMKERLKVLSEARKLFLATPCFKKMDVQSRYEIAGLVEYKDIDFLCFGSMQGAGKFWSAIKRNSSKISDALDLIPLEGKVTRNHYLSFIKKFREAFPKGGGGLATATRLLAMKRPDVFVCLDKPNLQRLCESFKIRQRIGFDEYWDSIVERIRASTWWNSRQPKNPRVAMLWDSRAAMLDALFYKWR